MYKFLTFLLAIVLPFSSISQTCDIALTGYTPPPSGEGLHTFTVNWTNTENCGCNEFTQWDGNNCDESTSTHVNNNESISHIVFGIHYVNEETGEDYGENTECTSTTFHPGWSFVLSVPISPNGFQSGSSSTFAVNPPYSWECILENPIEGYCWEVVVWQINLSQTATNEDFGDDGWSSGTNFNNTQTYPDINLSDNVISWCPDPIITDTVYVYETDTIFVYEIDTLYVQLPPDTIVELQIDTVFTQEYVYITDTLVEYITDTVFVDNYIYTIDTLYLDNFIYDTTFVEIIDYVFLTDTIIEYIEIDCETGLPCDNLGIDECDGGIFIPNVFTPNNDGWNDVWKPIYDLECWVNVEFKIYNRWGSLVYEGWNNDFWDGSNKGGPSYVADGIYVYTFRARKYNSAEVFEKNGHLTILR